MSHPRRSFVLLTVLMISGSALFIATGLLFLVQAEATSAAVARDAAQRRALAWSGVQLVMSELDRQRERILEGEQPTIDSQFVIYHHGDRVGVARLQSVDRNGGVLEPQASKIDVNHADEQALVATGMIDEALAAAIVRERAARGGAFHSIGDLLNVPGVTPELLYGPPDEIADGGDDGEASHEPSLADALAPGVSALDDLLTVFAFEPLLQRSGALRINVNVPWSEELGRRVDDRFGPGSSEVLRSLSEGGVTLDSDAAIVKALRRVGAPPRDWPEILDALTTRTGEYVGGRLDLNTAPLEALLSLGLETEQATQIIQMREDLPAAERWTPVWPVLQEILTAAQFEAIADRVTARSWTYRVRLAAGEVAADTPDAAIDQPVVYEAVIDLAGPAARLAYFREVTWLPVAAKLASSAPDEQPEDAFAEEAIDSPELSATSGAPAVSMSAATTEGADDDPASPDAQAEDPADGSATEASGEPAAGQTITRIGRWRSGK